MGTSPVAERPNHRRDYDRHSTDGRIVLEDLELIERVKAGNTESFGRLVEKYQDRVFNACWRICGHLEDARDITQDAFLKAFENISLFRQCSGFYTWVFRIAVNMSLSHCRKAKTRRAVSIDQRYEGVGGQAEELVKRIQDVSVPDPAEGTSDSELRGRAAGALQSLDSDQRAVVVLRDIEGLNYAEIAEVLQIPPGTVKSRVHRARMALRSALSPALDEKRE